MPEPLFAKEEGKSHRVRSRGGENKASQSGQDPHIMEKKRLVRARTWSRNGELYAEIKEEERVFVRENACVGE